MDLPAPACPASSSKEDVRRFLEEYEAFFTALREDPVAWAEWEEERRDWDAFFAGEQTGEQTDE